MVDSDELCVEGVNYWILLSDELSWAVCKVGLILSRRVCLQIENSDLMYIKAEINEVYTDMHIIENFVFC